MFEPRTMPGEGDSAGLTAAAKMAVLNNALARAEIASTNAGDCADVDARMEAADGPPTEKTTLTPFVGDVTPAVRRPPPAPKSTARDTGSTTPVTVATHETQPVAATPAEIDACNAATALAVSSVPEASYAEGGSAESKTAPVAAAAGDGVGACAAEVVALAVADAVATLATAEGVALPDREDELLDVADGEERGEALADVEDVALPLKRKLCVASAELVELLLGGIVPEVLIEDKADSVAPPDDDSVDVCVALIVLLGVDVEDELRDLLARIDTDGEDVALVERDDEEDARGDRDVEALKDEDFDGIGERVGRDDTL